MQKCEKMWKLLFEIIFYIKSNEKKLSNERANQEFAKSTPG